MAGEAPATLLIMLPHSLPATLSLSLSLFPLLSLSLSVCLSLLSFLIVCLPEGGTSREACGSP